MMKAIIDQNMCTGCGLCPDTCPEVFEMDGDTHVSRWTSCIPRFT